jgi:hypothetical protein
MPKLNEQFRDSEIDQLVFVLPEDDGDPDLPPPPEPQAIAPEREEIDDYTAELLPDYGKPEWEEIDHYTTERPLEDGDPTVEMAEIQVITYNEFLPL